MQSVALIHSFVIVLMVVLRNSFFMLLMAHNEFMLVTFFVFFHVFKCQVIFVSDLRTIYLYRIQTLLHNHYDLILV